jgi:predicted alpha/beta-fold hydrolase
LYEENGEDVFYKNKAVVFTMLTMSRIWTVAGVLAAILLDMTTTLNLAQALTTTTTTTTKLIQLQQDAARTIATFPVKESFEPVIRNGHAQTILGFLCRQTCGYVAHDESPFGLLQKIRKGLASAQDESGNSQFWDHREHIASLDGDFFHADYKYVNSCNDNSANVLNMRPTVILLHGLQSSSYSTLSVELAEAFNQQGMNCVCLNFRGCSKDAQGVNIPNDKKGGYHLGFTDDLLQFIDLFQARNPESSIYLCGFSLGANVVLKCLGDLAQDAVGENIAGAAVICAPLDQTKNSPVLAKPFSIQRFLYSNALLKSLQSRAQMQLRQFPEGSSMVDVERVMAATTITDFDDAYIAPLYGFKECWDYYKQTSSIHVLDKICVPTFILNARDDPFFDNTVWPIQTSCENGGPAPLKLMRTDSGGHLGFLFHQVDRNDVRLATNVPSWGSYQAARFLAHVDKSRTDNE